MASSPNPPRRPGAWCRMVSSWLPEQSGIVQDAAEIGTLLSQLAAQDPDGDTFVVLLESIQLNPDPKVAEAARRIQTAWEREIAETNGTGVADKPRVLVVDDEPPICDLVAAALERRFAVTIATSGEEALERARAEPPDLVVLDVMMPGMDGYEVARTMRADSSTADVPILFCTARSGLEARVMGRDAGGSGYAVKPFELHRLAAQAAVIAGIDPLGA